MKYSLSWFRRIALGIWIILGLVFKPQYPVFAAANLTVTPITWNVIGLDSNNVNAGPNTYPVGVRVCNTGDAVANNVTATFVWDSINANIDLRPGSLNPITLSSLANGSCSDLYFDVTIMRTAAAYDATRAYHIDVTATGLGTVSTPAPRELYVEHLVSQNRNSVLDMQLDGVSIAAGGLLNLLVGNTYTITLLSDTATNGYEQIEAFINFPNTIFQILNVATVYTADGGTDLSAASKLYADGCGWVNDPTNVNYKSCTGVGKYGGVITTTYTVKIIAGAGTSQTLNTLIYDFSGSSYHYNTDFSLAARYAIISDPATCTQITLATWQYSVNGNTAAPTTGAGTFASSGLLNLSTPNDGNPARSLLSEGWPSTRSASDYLEYHVSTVGYYSIRFNFDVRFNNGGGGSLTGPNALDVAYSTSAVPSFTDFATNQSVTSGWTSKLNDLASIIPLENNANSRFRIHAYNADSNDQLRVDNVTVSGCALPASINLTKNGVIDPTIVPPNNEVNVGDRVNYTIVITNNGGVPLTNIILTDNKAASLTCTPSLAGLILLPGESVTCTGFYTLTQADFDTGSVTNTATADSDQIGPVSASTTQPLPQTPALTLAKAANTQTYTTLGQQVTYTYTLTNTGNVTLTAPYTVTDNRVIVDCTGAASPLLPGASTTCTATYTITDADIQAGTVINIATAAATFGNTTVTSNVDSATVNYAALNIVKEVSADGVTWNDTSVIVNVGDTVYYRIRVQNTGNLTLTVLTVDDGMAGCTLTRGADDPGDNDADFEPAETWVYTCSVVAIEGMQNNTAAADSAETDQDSDDASYFGANPSLSILKSVTTNGPYSVGQTINYNIVVMNTGNITLTGVTVTDNSAIVGTCTPAQPASLAPGATMTCPASHVVIQADVDNGDYTNTATGASDQTPPSNSTVPVTFTQNPGIVIVKSSNATGINAVGDTITYTYSVENIGTVTLTSVIVTDNHAGLSAISCTPAQGSSLAPGATMTCTATYIVTQADVGAGQIDNIGVVIGTPPNGPNVTDNDPLSEPLAQNPGIAIVKSSNATGTNVVGDTITYTYDVENTGNVTLTNVTVTDNHSGLSAISCTPAQGSTLAPAETMTCTATYTITQADVDTGQIDNIGVVTGTPPNGPNVTDNDPLSEPLAQNPGIAIIKSSNATGTNVMGDTITYTYSVENIGNVILANVTVTDNHAGLSAISCTPAQGSTLAPGATMTCTATYTITQADVDAGQIDNIGVVTGTPPNGTDVTDNDPLSEPLAQSPQLGIVKSEVSSGPYLVGDTINYSIIVTNTGNITLTNVTVNDNSAVIGVCAPSQPATLAPGVTMTCSASHVVTQADADNRSYVNTATADSNETLPATSTVTIGFDVADLSLAKAVTDSNPGVSTDISFIITVTNRGPENATGVEVTEVLQSGFTFVSAAASQGSYNSTTGLWQIGNLALNQSVSLTIIVNVKAAGSYTNTAEISASGIIDPDSTPNNQNPNEDDQALVTIAPRPDGNNPPPAPRPTPIPASAPVVGGFLIPVTGFAPDMVSDLSQVPYTAYSDTSITLEIPSLAVNIPVVGVPLAAGGWNVSWLGKQAGWLEGSAFPSWNGNSVLTSHVYLSNGKPGPFARLHELKFGDQIIVHAYGQKYIFEVRANAIVAPNDKSVMRHEEKPWLTLVTCTDYDEKTDTYKNRFIVRAVLMKVIDDR